MMKSKFFPVLTKDKLPDPTIYPETPDTEVHREMKGARVQGISVREI